MVSQKCIRCQAELGTNQKFCPHCGAPQKQPPAENKKCVKCNHVNPASAIFCEKCGNSLTKLVAASQPKQTESNKIVSKGNYTGTMIKGKASKSWNRFKYAIIIAVVVVAIALIIWFQVDPDAGEKLKTFIGGLLIVTIFLFIIFKRNKKGRSRRRGGSFRSSNRNDYDRDEDQNNDDGNDDDYDDDGDDDYDDD